MNMLNNFADWLDERTGWRTLKKTILDRHIPDGVGWPYVLGSACLFIFAMQGLTGVLLAMNYSPSPEHAYNSVRFIEEQVPMGHLIRGMHKWGATLMVVLVFLHMVRTYFMAAYKRPREFTWLVGVGLFFLTLGFGFTGYLLPWDQKAYWATRVGVTISTQVPFLGAFMAKVLKGGDELGTVTLARFFAGHVLVLPALILGMIGAHLFLVVWHGISAPPEKKIDSELPPEPRKAWAKLKEWYAAKKEAGLPFHPFSTGKDTIFAAFLLVVLFVLAIYVGAELEAPSDPTDTTYNPRPEWYFLFLFEALKYFPGNLEALAAIVLPGVVAAFLAALPFIDRSPYRTITRRPVLTGAGVLGLALIGWLSYAGARAPLTNPQVKRDPLLVEGRQLYEKLRCGYCHSIRGLGGKTAPDLARMPRGRDAEWLTKHLYDPKQMVPGSTMPAFKLLEDEAGALVAFMLSLNEAVTYSVKAPQLFTEHCASCHAVRGKGGNAGPDLSQVGVYREAPWIAAYINDPVSINHDAAMPAFKGEIQKADMEDLARYLVAQRAAKP